MNYENGIHTISNSDYHRADGVSRSALMRLAKSPKHLKHYQPDDLDTNAITIGECVHTMLLEPLLYAKTFAVAPEAKKRTKEGKRLWENFAKLNQGKKVLSASQFKAVNAIVTTLKEHPLVSVLLMNASCIEQSIFFTHQEPGIQCKSRTDFVAGKAIVDLKTTADASYYAFQRSASKYGYFLQAAMTKAALDSAGIQTSSNIIIAIESSYPFACSVFRLDEQALMAGHKKFNRLMKSYQQVINSNEYEDYGMMTLSAPSWELDDEQ